MAVVGGGAAATGDEAGPGSEPAHRYELAMQLLRPPAQAAAPGAATDTPPLERDVRVGFGRIAASEIEAPIMLGNLV